MFDLRRCREGDNSMIALQYDCSLPRKHVCMVMVILYVYFVHDRNVDKATGFRTRNILCQPLRLNHGGGAIIAVLQMLNKINSPTFDEEDTEILRIYGSRIADELNSRFSELLRAAEMFHSEGDIMDGSQSKHKRFDSNTLSSRMRQVGILQDQHEYAKLRMQGNDRDPFAPVHAGGRYVTRKPRPSDAIAVRTPVSILPGLTRRSSACAVSLSTATGAGAGAGAGAGSMTGTGSKSPTNPSFSTAKGNDNPSPKHDHDDHEKESLPPL